MTNLVKLTFLLCRFSGSRGPRNPHEGSNTYTPPRPLGATRRCDESGLTVEYYKTMAGVTDTDGQVKSFVEERENFTVRITVRKYSGCWKMKARCFRLEVASLRWNLTSSIISRTVGFRTVRNRTEAPDLIFSLWCHEMGRSSRKKNKPVLSKSTTSFRMSVFAFSIATNQFLPSYFFRTNLSGPVRIFHIFQKWTSQRKFFFV